MSTVPQEHKSESWTDAAKGAVAHIGKSVVIRGELSGSEDLVIDGQVEGTIELREHNLTIGPNGRVQANLNAREVVIQGTVHGNIKAVDRVDIRKSGSLTGDLTAARIVIEDGAYFKGSIDIQKDKETAKSSESARSQTGSSASSSSSPGVPKPAGLPMEASN